MFVFLQNGPACLEYDHLKDNASIKIQVNVNQDDLQVFSIGRIFAPNLVDASQNKLELGL